MIDRTIKASSVLSLRAALLRGIAMGSTALVGIALPAIAQAQEVRLVTTETELRAAIDAANGDTATSTFIIRLGGSITLTQALPPLNRPNNRFGVLDFNGFGLTGAFSPAAQGGGQVGFINGRGTVTSSTGTAIGTGPAGATSFELTNLGIIAGATGPAVAATSGNVTVVNEAGATIRSQAGPALALSTFNQFFTTASLNVTNAGTIRSDDGAGITFSGKGTSAANLLAGSTTGTIGFSNGGTVNLDGENGIAAAAVVGTIDFGPEVGPLGIPGILTLRSGNGAIDLSTVRNMDELNKRGAGSWTLTGASASPGATINAGGDGLIPALDRAIAANAPTAGTLIFDTTGLTGTINLNGGTIRAARAGAFGTGAINSFDPRIEYGATGTYANAIFLAARDPAADPTVLAADTGVVATLSGAITQSQANGAAAQPLVIDGAGSVTLTNTANLWNGTTTINAGATLIGTGATISGGAIANNGALVYNQVANSTSTVAQVISGTGTLTKQGAGTTTLSGANSYTGATTIAGGTLEVLGQGSRFNAGFVPEDVNTIASSSAVALTGADAVLAFSNANGLNDGDGNINNLSGVAGSRVTLAGEYGYGALRVTADRASVFGGTIEGVDVGQVQLAVTGTTPDASLTLTANNAALTDVQASGATLRLAGGGAFANASLFVSASGNGPATFDIAGIDAASTTIRALDGSGSVLLGAKTLRVTERGDFDGVIAGSGGLTLEGLGGNAGVLTLYGINTYTGATTIAAGATLALASTQIGQDETTDAAIFADGSIAASSGVQADGTFDAQYLDGVTSIRALTGAGTGQVLIGSARFDETAQNFAVVPRTLTITNANGVFAGVISDMVFLPPNNQTDVGSNVSSGSGVTIAGGAQVFTGDNTYTGATTLAGGNLSLGNGGTTGSVAGPIALSGDNGQGTLTINRSDTGLVIAGAISGTGNVVQAGSGATTLGALNSYTGTTTIANGTLIVADGSGEGIGQSSAVALTGANAVLQFNSAYQGAVRNLSGVAGSRITFAPDADGNAFFNALSVTNSVDTVFGGTVTGAEAQEERPFGVQLSKFGAGALTLTAANANVDNAFVGEGALRLAGDASLTNAMVFLAGSETALSFDISGVAAPETTIVDLGGGEGSFVLLGAKTLRVSNARSGYNGVISGSGGLTIEGGQDNPRLSLGGTNTYTGATTIAAGATLALASTQIGQDETTDAAIFADGSIAASSGVQADGTFDAQYLDGVTSVRALTGAGTGQVLIGSARFDETAQNFAVVPRTLTITNANGVFAGVISDMVFLPNNQTGVGSNVSSGSGVTIAGGTQVFTGTNTYTGTTTLAGGNLSLGNGGTTGSVAGPIALTNGTLTINRSNAVTLPGVISGAGNLVQAGTGTTTLTAANTYTGTTSINAGTLALAGNGSLTSQVIVATGAAFDISGATSGAATARGLSGTGNTALGANTLTLTGASDSYAGVLSGTGGLTVAGGRQVLTGTNSYTGPTTVAAGAALGLGNGSTTGSVAGPIVANGTVDLNRSGDYTLANVVSGGGTVNKLGAGTTTLSGRNGAGAQFTGTANVNAGTLSVGGVFGDTAGNTALVNVNTGATLHGTGTIAGSVAVNNGGTVSAGNSPGTLTVLGNYTLGAGSNSIFELGTPDVVGGATNDLINVGGNLTLGGTLTLVNSLDASMALASGDYRLFNYGGTLAGSFAAVNSGATDPAEANVDTGVAGQVNLNVRALGQQVQYWDGTDTGAVRGPQGGPGTWNTTNTNWTGENTNADRAWRSGVGIFGTTGGTVRIEGAQAFQGLQFTVNGYQLTGPGSLTMTGDPFTTADQSFVTVDPGVAATIAASLTGNGIGLVKYGAGNLVLSGTNTYTGTTTVAAGTLTGTTTSIVGGNIVNNGTLAYTQSSGSVGQAITGTGNVTVSGASGGIVTFSGTNALTGAVGGPAAFTSFGPGLAFTGTTTSVVDTVALAGTAARLQVGFTGSLTSSAGNAVVASQPGATIVNAGTIRATAAGGIGVLGTAVVGTTTIANANGATISGGLRGIDLSGIGNVSNAGTIAGGTSTGVLLRGGGNVDNSGTGTISGGSNAVTFIAAGNLSNAGRVTGASNGVAQNAAAALTLTNTGTINGGTAGVAMNAGGALTLSNAAGAAIAGTQNNAVYTGTAAGEVFNAGLMTGGNAAVYADGALTLTNSGTIRNTTGGNAQATSGVYSSAANAQITNSGTIDSQVAGGRAIKLDGGTSTITNLSGGTLAGNGGGAAVLLAGAGYTLDLRNGSTTTGGIDARATTGTNALTLGGSLTGGYIGGSGTDTVTLIDNASFTGALDGGAGADTVTLTGTGNGTVNVGNLVRFETVAKTGSGRFTLSGTDASTANFRIDQGILTVSGGAAINDDARVDIANAGTLDLGTGEAIGALAGAGAVTLGGNTLSVVGGQSTSYAGVISGAGGLNRSGTGTLTLAGANSYTGATAVAGGTLALGASNVLADATAVSVAAGGTLDLGTNSDTVRSLALAGTLGGTGTLTAASYTLTGGTANANLGSGTLTQASGTSTLNGTAAAGTVNVTGGTLVLGASNRLADNAGLTIANGATLNLGAFNDTVGTAALSGTLAGTGTLTAATYALNGATVTANLGAGALTQAGGTTTLNGTTAAATVNVTGGTLALGASERLANAAALAIGSDGVLDLGTFVETVGTAAIAGRVNGTGALNAGSYTLTGGTVNANLGAGTLTQASGTSTLNGTSAATTVAVSGGTLVLGASNRLADNAGLTVANGATLNLAAFSDTVGTAALAGTLAGTGTLTAASYALNGATVNANLGTGTLTQSAGTSVLTGTSAATNVAINGGTLRLGAAERLANTAAVTVAQGATFDLAGVAETIGNVAGAGTVALGVGSLTFGGGNADTSFSGAVTGSGDFVKTGTGTLALAGNAASTGRLVASAGTVALSGNNGGSARIAGATLLGGGGVAGNLALASGTLSPGTAATPVGTVQAGSLTVTGGTYLADVTGTSGGFGSDLVRVTGAATLSGGLVAPRAAGATSDYALVQTYTLLTAGSVSGTFANAAGFAAIGNDPALQYRLRYDLVPNAVLLELRRQVDFTAGLGAGATVNQRALGAAFNGGAFTASDDFARTLNAIQALSPAQARGSFDLIGGEAASATTTLVGLAGDRFTDIIRQRMATATGSGIGGQTLAGLGGSDSRAMRAASGLGDGASTLAGSADGNRVAVWLQGHGADGTLQGRDGTATVQSYAAGIVGGIEAKFGAVTIGAGGMVDDLEARLRVRQSRSTGTLYQGGGYVAYDDGRFFTNAVGSYFKADVDTRRQVYVGATLTGQARGSTDSDGYAVGGAFGYRLGGEEGIRLAPQIAGRMVSVTRDAYVESGAGGLSLAVGREERELYTATGELRLSHKSASASGTVEPWASAGIQKLWGGRDAFATNRITGAPVGTGAFQITGAGLPEWAGLIGGGIEAKPTDRVTLGASAESTISSRYKESRLSLRVRVGF